MGAAVKFSNNEQLEGVEDRETGMGVRTVVPEGHLRHPHQSANALLLGPPSASVVRGMEAARLLPALTMRLTQKGPPRHWEHTLKWVFSAHV